MSDEEIALDWVAIGRELAKFAEGSAVDIAIEPQRCQGTVIVRPDGNSSIHLQTSHVFETTEEIEHPVLIYLVERNVVAVERIKPLVPGARVLVNPPPDRRIEGAVEGRPSDVGEP